RKRRRLAQHPRGITQVLYESVDHSYSVPGSSRNVADLRGVNTSTMNRQERPTITAAEPQLFVSDLRASCDFFTQKLGFKIAFLYGDPPHFGQVIRDGARLNLKSVDVPIIDNALRDREELLSATL